jgi:hypothetical protein
MKPGLLKMYPLFLYLLPVFFVLHGSAENYDFVPFGDAIILTAIYILSTFVVFIICRLFCGNWLKASLLAFLLVAFNFFFGSLHDGLRSQFPGSFIVKYIFLIPFFVILFILVIIGLKRTKKNLRPALYYLNILLLVLVFIDTVWLTSKVLDPKKDKTVLSNGFTQCTNCDQPDVYLIIADEYPGNTELKDLFNFDNSPFLDQLANRGFHTVPNSSSNYNYTPYSIASILNMDYLDLDREGKQPLLAYTYETTSENKILQFFQYQGYKIHNYSLSDFKGYPSHAQETFLPVKTKLITSQTFLSRMEKELGFHWILRSKRAMKKLVYRSNNNNEKLSQLVIQTSGKKTRVPKFVIAHLMMPHYPYYYDKNGNEFPFDLVIEGNQDNQHNFIEYLQYSNKKFLTLIDHILNNSTNPPVIILVGDHGFRHFKKPVERKYYFRNLMSVHLPTKNYSAFTDSLTNVNLLRTVLNTSFNQRLPILEDTTIIMDNP